MATSNTTLKVGAYRAYLDLPSLGEGGIEIGAKAYRMIFEDGDATGIDETGGDAAQSSSSYYDLMGRKVNAPQKGGIYVVNGKKVLMK